METAGVKMNVKDANIILKIFCSFWFPRRTKIKSFIEISPNFYTKTH